MITKKIIFSLLVLALLWFILSVIIPDSKTDHGLAGYKEGFDHTNPREVCDYFCVNLLHAPEQAYTFFSQDHERTSLEQFLKGRKVILPKSRTITSVEFLKAEHGFTNMTLEIDVFEKENVYYVLRYGVISE